MSMAAALTRPNPLTAEECTNKVFAGLDKDNNGEDSILCSTWPTAYFILKILKLFFEFYVSDVSM